MRQMLITAGGVALGFLIVLLLLNISHVTDKIVGWDDEAKAAYAHQLDLNRQYVELARQAEARRYDAARRIAERNRQPLCELDNTCEP